MELHTIRSKSGTVHFSYHYVAGEVVRTLCGRALTPEPHEHFYLNATCWGCLEAARKRGATVLKYTQENPTEGD